ETVFAGDEERIDEHFDPADIFLINATIPAEDQVGNQAALGYTLLNGYDTGSADPNPLVRRLVQNWSGPFISFQRFWYDFTPVGIDYDGPGDPDYRDSDDLFRDFPLDPCGNPYRFYSPLGIIGGDLDDEECDFDDPAVDFSNGGL